MSETKLFRGFGTVLSSTFRVHGERSSLASQLVLQSGFYLELIITDVNFQRVDSCYLTLSDTRVSC